MSRSKRKTPGWKDRSPFMKNIANRRIRRKSIDYDMANGSNYKKETCSWDISDWKFLLYTDEDVKEYCEKFNELPFKPYKK